MKLSDRKIQHKPGTKNSPLFSVDLAVLSIPLPSFKWKSIRISKVYVLELMRRLDIITSREIRMNFIRMLSEHVLSFELKSNSGKLWSCTANIHSEFNKVDKRRWSKKVTSLHIATADTKKTP